MSHPSSATVPPQAPSRAIFLDAGGVLHLPDHARVQAALAAVGARARASDLDRAHYFGMAAQDAAPAESGWGPYRIGYLRTVGVPEARLEATWPALEAVLADPETWRRPVDGARHGLRALVRARIAIVVVSNADGTVARRLAEARLCQVGKGRGAEVVEVLDSAVVGVAKPDARIFELALRAAGLPRDRVAHVGDAVRYDVRGAEAAGVRAVHFDPVGLCEDGSHEHLGDLRELATLFD